MNFCCWKKMHSESFLFHSSLFRFYFLNRNSSVSSGNSGSSVSSESSENSGSSVSSGSSENSENSESSVNSGSSVNSESCLH